MRGRRRTSSAILAPGPQLVRGLGVTSRVGCRRSRKEPTSQPSANRAGCALLLYMRVYGRAGTAASSQLSILCSHSDLPAAGRSSRSLVNLTTPTTLPPTRGVYNVY
eukprot:COSAG01_NODE_2916_length_6860_cov_159.736430_3_plen_107_part_00